MTPHQTTTTPTQLDLAEQLVPADATGMMITAAPGQTLVQVDMEMTLLHPQHLRHPLHRVVQLGSRDRVVSGIQSLLRITPKGHLVPQALTKQRV